MKPDENKRRHITVVGRSGMSEVNWDDIQNKPDFAEVATSGDYGDLENKPQLATVATSGSYNDLSNKPTIPAAQVNADWNSASGVAQILNKPNLATVATTGSYNDLTDKPTATQEQADWNQTDNAQVDYIKNKPTIPTVPAMAIEELTFTLEGGTTKTIEFYTAPNYFYVEDISGSNNTLSIKKSSASAPTIEVFCSTDRANWTSMGTTSTTAITATIPANGKLYLKANANSWSEFYNDYYNEIKAGGNHNVGGNVMSLLYGDNFTNKTMFPNNQSGLQCIFSYDNYLIDASKLILPATTLTEKCYKQMFIGSRSLTSAPVLPATTLAVSCYSNMFWSCWALTTAPELPATTLTRYCYFNMFRDCKALTTAPELPATTLVSDCYSQMFYDCRALTTAPELPATSLASSCYSYMFKNCTSLTTAPELPATSLSYCNFCYSGMFNGCTSLVEAPELPADTLVQSCYQAMFQGCTSLNKMSVYATDISASDCTTNWLNNVSATGDFANWGGASYTRDASGIPAGWNEIN